MKKTYELRMQNRSGKACTTQSQRLETSDNTSTGSSTSTSMPRPQPEQEPTLADLKKSLNDFSTKVCNKLDEIHADISSMKKQIIELETAVEDNSARMLDLEKEKMPELESKLRKEIEALKEKLILSEIYQRKSNLLFYGLEKKPNENIRNVLLEVFMMLGLTEEESRAISLANAHRLPNRNTSSNAPPPIIAKFVYMEQRNRLLAAYEKRSTRRGIDQQNGATPTPRISVRTDLPPALKAERSILATKAYKLRKEENLSTKITLVGSKVVLYTKAKNGTEWKSYKE